MVLPEIVTKERLGLAVRHGDDEWADVVSWSYYAMVQGEEFGLTSDSMDEIRASTQNPDIKRFLGDTDELGDAMGLPTTSPTRSSSRSETTGRASSAMSAAARH